MTNQAFQSPFPKLELSQELTLQLEALADMLVEGYLRQYEQYLDKADVDTAKWKFVRERDSVRVFVERHEHKPQEPFMPKLLVMGSMQGNLDDTMFGTLCPTLESIRLKTAYCDDRIVNAAVLATMIRPTASDPFRSLAIKWYEKGQSLPIRSMVKNRDYVLLESIGVRELPSGERVGFQLIHSVHFPQTNALPTVMRGNMSMCGLYRQRDNSSVDIYVNALFNPTSAIMRAIIIQSASQVVVSTRKFVHCAEMKKLAWLLRHHRHSSSSEKVVPALRTSDVCATCASRPTSGRFFDRKGKSSSCAVCCQVVCSSCRLQRKMSFVDANLQLSHRTITVCGSCHDRAQALSATTVAGDEVVAKFTYQFSDVFRYNSLQLTELTDQESRVTLET